MVKIVSLTMNVTSNDGFVLKVGWTPASADATQIESGGAARLKTSCCQRSFSFQNR